jgi:large subunit ribosomal protein L10
MPTEKKIQEVEELTEKLNRSSVLIGADYRGLNVSDSTALRKTLRDAGLQMQVVKNTLFLRATDAAGLKDAAELAEGPTAIIFGFDDPILPIKTVVDYQRAARNAFTARKAFLDGQIIPGPRLAEFAALPSKDQLIAEIAGALQSPITNLVYLFTATVQEFSGLLQARADQLGDGDGDAPASAEAVEASSEPSESKTEPAEDSAEPSGSETEPEEASPEPSESGTEAAETSAESTEA